MHSLRPGSRDPSDKPPVIIIHSVAHALAALSAAVEAQKTVVLAGPRDAGIYAGAGWFREVIGAARAALPEARFSALIDCGEDAGAAMAAIRAGIASVVFTGRGDVAARLADIARQQNAILLATRPLPGLDLGEIFFATPDELRRRCLDLLSAA